ncbi:MAG: hypothetical protein R6V03_00575 [Kiritimatiellia bacterium]
MKGWVYTGLICALLLPLSAAFFPAFAESTINTNNCWAWGAGSGWLNCRPDSTNGVVVGEYVCSGWMYSPAVGWISLGDGTPTNGVQYTNNSTNDYGVNHDGKGNLSGYAWGASAGWINFGWTNAGEPNAPTVDLKNGCLGGYAWGSSMGWVSLSNSTAYVQTDSLDSGADDDGDGIPDSWEITKTGSTDLLGSGTSNYDGDLLTDYEEYVAGTCPTNPNDYLMLADILGTGTNTIRLTWNSDGSRMYKIETRSSLITGSWANAGLFSPGTGSLTACIFSNAVTPELFYRLRAMLPLSE